MSGKFALIIGNTEYTDPGLAQLTAPGRDAEDLAHILQDPQIGAFDDVRVLLNQFSSTIVEAIDEFFNHKKPDDLLLLYFSGHGIRDEFGALYLAVRNTFRAKLRSTAVKSDYIREVMDQSRSRRQVLILDCCNSGAFAQGTKSATGVSIGTASAFEGGYGRVILTASDSTQYAWEGDQVIGETDNSLFTHYLVEGLKGEADLDGNGRITVDELYDYTYEKVKLATPKQTPSKFSSKQQGEIILRHNLPTEDIKSVPLPTPLLDSIENPFADIRLGAVRQLEKILNGRNLGMARSAREVLERIVAEDDSRQVSRAAAQALESVRTGKQADRNYIAEVLEKDGWQLVNERAEKVEQQANAKDRQPATQMVEAQRAEKLQEISSKPVTEQTTPAISSQQGLMWITLGWVIAGLIGGVVYWNGGDFSVPLGGAINWGIGGLVTAFVLRARNILAPEKNIYWVTLAWLIGGAIGWTIGDAITEAYGAGVGGVIGVAIALAGTFDREELLAHWKPFARLIIIWGIVGAIGWSIGKAIQENDGSLLNVLYIGKAGGWAIGWAIAGIFGGYVLGRFLLKVTKEASRGQFDGKGVITAFIEKHKVFLLSWQGRSLIGVTVGLILGLLFGVLYGIIHDISYDLAYAYLNFDEGFPHSPLVVICGLAGLIAYPHKGSIFLMIGGFIVVVIAKSQGHLVYDLIAYGGVYGLPTGALISRVLFWLGVIK